MKEAACTPRSALVHRRTSGDRWHGEPEMAEGHRGAADTARALLEPARRCHRQHSLNTALPTLARVLHAGTSSLQWIVDGYTLCFAAF